MGRNRNRTKWWNRPVDSFIQTFRLALVGIPLGLMVLIGLISTRWLLITALSLLAAGFLVAVVIRIAHRKTAASTRLGPL